jgi:Na+/H+ antiporter NhaC
MLASKRQIGLAMIIIFAFSALAWFFQIRSGTNEYHWYSILPPVFAVACAIATRQLLLSLSAGVISGAFLINVPAAPLQLSSWLDSAVTVLMQLWNVISDPFNLSVLAFIILMLMMISVVILSGGLLAIVSWLERFAQGPRSTQFVTSLMGFVVFIDDYANVMIVGSSMRPISDAMQISREKLAFLVDATSAPVAGIALMSTWIGYEVGIFAEVSSSLGFNRDAYSMFLDALSFRFYCIFMILFIMINVWSGREFGSMLKAERRSRAGAIVAEDALLPTKIENEVKPDEQAIIRASTALLPVGVLFCILFAGLWIDGGGLALLSESMGNFLSFTAWRNVISASENNVQVLIFAGAFSLLTAFVCTLLLARLSFEHIAPAVKKGAKSALYPWLILILAWSLGGICEQIETGPFLVAITGEAIPAFMYPLIVFVLSAAAAIATGTSWGTMAIFIPITSQLAFQIDGESYGLITMMSLAAVLDGAIFGDHCSPISDTTIMSSISTSCDHLHHVRTQFPYATIVACFAMGLGYLPAVAGMNLGVSLILALAGFMGFLKIFARKVD